MSPTLAPLFNDALRALRELRGRGATCTLQHIYREFNTLADGLANEALDSGDMLDNWAGVDVTIDDLLP